MSKIHVLENTNKKYKVVLHFTVPTGNNSAGNSWKDCALAQGLGATVMQEGYGVGQITPAEKNSIVAGDVIEVTDTILAESGNASVESLDEMADKIIAEKKKTLQEKYKYYGYVQG